MKRILLACIVMGLVCGTLSSSALPAAGDSGGPATQPPGGLTLFLPLVSQGCQYPCAPFHPSGGALRGLFDSSTPGDTGRMNLGRFDSLTGLRHYFIKFYWNLEDETVTNGAGKSIDAFAKEVWSAGRMPVLDIRTRAFVDNETGLSSLALDRLQQFAGWLRDSYTGQITVPLFAEMNLKESPYCPSAWDAAACIRVFKKAFAYTSRLLGSAAPGRVHIGLNYNMRWLAGDGSGTGSRYSDWQVDRGLYDWVGYNIFVHACKNDPPGNDLWYLKGALNEGGNNFIQSFCSAGPQYAPCIIAETGASDSCTPGYQTWWIDRFAIGSDPGLPYMNLQLPEIKGYIWFNQDNSAKGGWEENWMVQDIPHYRAVFGDPYYVDAP